MKQLFAITALIFGASVGYASDDPTALPQEEEVVILPEPSEESSDQVVVGIDSRAGCGSGSCSKGSGCGCKKRSNGGR